MLFAVSDRQSLAEPDFDPATAFPELGQLRQALLKHDWPGVCAFFSRLSQPGDSDTVGFATRFAGEVDGTEDFLRERASTETASTLARTLYAARLIELGWQARTGYRARYVNAQQFASFHDYLRQAERVLIDVVAYEPTNVAAWVLRLKTARGLELGQAEARRRYDQGARHNPHNLDGQVQLLQQLCPKWSGSFEQAREFAWASASAAPQGAPNAALIAEAHLEQWLEIVDKDGRPVNVLTGHPNPTLDELRGELNAVTVADVHRVAADVMATALLMTPRGHTADWAGFTAAPTYSNAAVAGQPYPSLDQDGVTLVVGPEGASIVTGSGPATVRFDECAVVLAWPDGARRLVGYDGMTIAVEPTLYKVDASALAAIDTGMPPAAVVWQPARSPEAIPKPNPAPRQPAPTGASRGVLEKTIMIALFVFASCVACFALLATVGITGDPATETADWFGVGFFWLVAIMFGGAGVIIYRQRRRVAQARALT
jgi:hypothetical protein